MRHDDSAGAAEPGGLSRRDAIGAAAVVASFLLLPSAASGEATTAFPVTVRISWRAGEPRGGGATTIAVVTAAVAAVSSAGRAIWVHRFA